MLNFSSDLWSLLSNPTANKEGIIQYLNTKNESGRSFIASCEVEDFNKILLSLKDHPEILQEVLMQENELGYSVLMEAINSLNLEIVNDILLSLKDHPAILLKVLKQVDKSNFSPLHNAISLGYSVIAKKILSFLKNHPEILQEVLMQENKKGFSVLVQAIASQHPEIVNDILLSLKDHPDILQEVLMQNYRGYSVLRIAILSQNPEIVNDILSFLKDHPEILQKVLMQEDEFGNSVLIDAISPPNPEIVNDILLSLKDHPEILQEVLMQKDNYGNSVLMQAISSQDPEIVNDILLSLQDHPAILLKVLKQVDKSNFSPLHNAIRLGYPVIAEKILLSLKDHPQILQEVLMQKDCDNRSLFNYAIFKGNLQIVKKILSVVDEQTRDIIFDELDLNSDKVLFEAMRMLFANDYPENTNREEILKLLVKNKFNIDLDQSQILALTSFYKNHALLGLMTQDSYGVGNSQNPHNLTKILNEVVESSESQDLRKNPIAQIYANQIVKFNGDEPILTCDNKALHVYFANVPQHASYVIFNVDQTTNILKSISYCDGNFYPKLGDQRPHQDSLLPATVYGVREFELENEVKFSKEFAQKFIKENFQGKDLNSLQLPFRVDSQNIAIKGITANTRTRGQRRGNCSFKSANILARYLLEKQTSQDCLQDYQEFKKQLRSQVVKGLVKDYEKIKEQLGEKFVEHLGIEKRLNEVAKEKFGIKQPELFETAIADLRLRKELTPRQSIKVSCFSCLGRVFSRTTHR